MSKCLFAKKITIKRKESDIMRNEKARTIYASCRKCFNCQMRQRKSEIKRVFDEAKYYKYHLMITLTYDNKHIRLRNVIDEILEKNITQKEKFERLIEFDKIKDFIRNYDNESVDELEKFIYYELINEYATLHYNDIKKYLNTLKKAIKRDKEIKNENKKIAYYGCGEYPLVRIARGRPHYHAVFLFNDIDLIKHFIKSWKLGNITIARGDNQIDESINALDYNHVLTNADRLNCICKQETIKNDIVRVVDYIKNNKIKIDNKNNMFEVYYIASYTNKKIEATYFESIRKRNKEISQYYTIKNMNADIEYKQIRNIMKLKRQVYLKERARGVISIEKEEPFRFKSARLGYRYAIDNKERFIKNPCEVATTQSNYFAKQLINNYYIKVIVDKESEKDKVKATTILYNKNKIVKELEIKELENIKQLHNINYEIKEYYDNTIDIIDKTKNERFNINSYKEIRAYKKQDDQDALKRVYGEKDFKSDTFKIDYRQLKAEIKKHKDDLNKYLLNLLNRKYDNLELIKKN